MNKDDLKTLEKNLEHYSVGKDKQKEIDKLKSIIKSCSNVENQLATLFKEIKEFTSVIDTKEDFKSSVIKGLEESVTQFLEIFDEKFIKISSIEQNLLQEYMKRLYIFQIKVKVYEKITAVIKNAKSLSKELNEIYLGLETIKNSNKLQSLQLYKNYIINFEIVLKKLESISSNKKFIEFMEQASDNKGARIESLDQSVLDEIKKHDLTDILSIRLKY